MSSIVVRKVFFFLNVSLSIVIMIFFKKNVVLMAGEEWKML